MKSPSSFACGGPPIDRRVRDGCLTGPNHSGVELHGFLSYLGGVTCVHVIVLSFPRIAGI